MCRINYNAVLDTLQIVDKKYNAEKVDFFRLRKASQIYLIVENQKIIGLECLNFKNISKEFYKDKKKELCLKTLAHAKEFLRGSLYNLFKSEFLNNELKEERSEIVVSIKPVNFKSAIRELCPA